MRQALTRYYQAIKRKLLDVEQPDPAILGELDEITPAYEEFVKPHKALKIGIGLATLWLCFAFLVIESLNYYFFQTFTITIPRRDGFPSPHELVMYLTGVIWLGLWVFYCWHLSKYDRIISSELDLIFWVGFPLLPFLTMPVYYYLFIWRDQPPVWALK